LIHNLTERRNNLVAHLNYRAALNPLFLAELTFAETDKLIAVGVEIFNRYYYLFETTTQSGRLVSDQRKDYEQIFKSLRADPALHFNPRGDAVRTVP
jgi:hypothetical protein